MDADHPLNRGLIPRRSTHVAPNLAALVGVTDRALLPHRSPVGSGAKLNLGHPEPDLTAAVDHPAANAAAVDKDRVDPMKIALVGDPRRNLHRVGAAQLDGGNSPSVPAAAKPNNRAVITKSSNVGAQD